MIRIWQKEERVPYANAEGGAVITVTEQVILVHHKLNNQPNLYLSAIIKLLDIRKEC